MRILLAIDDSKFSQAATQAVASQIRPQGAEVLILQVVEPLAVSAPRRWPRAMSPRWLADKISHFFLVSSVASLLSVMTGFLLNTFVLRSLTMGPIIVIVSAFLLGLSLLKRMK